MIADAIARPARSFEVWHPCRDALFTWVLVRWCRFAQPPATCWDASGMPSIGSPIRVQHAMSRRAKFMDLRGGCLKLRRRPGHASRWLKSANLTRHSVGSWIPAWRHSDATLCASASGEGKALSSFFPTASQRRRMPSCPPAMMSLPSALAAAVWRKVSPVSGRG